MLRQFRFALWLAIAGLAGTALHAQSYDPVGPQTGVAAATVEAGGWTHCFSSPYAIDTGLYVSTIQAACTGAKLMLACAPAGESSLTLLAQAERTAVFTDPGDGQYDSHLANGSQWYFDVGGADAGQNSWGFAGAGDAVSRNSCDTESSDAATRLCWHLDYGGYRCGATLDLNESGAWTKYVYQYSSALFADGFEATGSVCAWSATSGAAADCSASLTLDLTPECGTIYVDQGIYDLDPNVDEVGYRFGWNDLPRESGYRLQVDYFTTFEAENEYVELPAGTIQTPIFILDTAESWTYRVMAHVGHAPGHGEVPIAGDVVSNPCTVQVALE